MNLTINIDWKFIVALGATTVGIIFAVKMDASAAERVSTHVADACKEYAIAGNGNWYYPEGMIDNTETTDGWTLMDLKTL